MLYLGNKKTNHLIRITMIDILSEKQTIAIMNQFLEYHIDFSFAQ